MWRGQVIFTWWWVVVAGREDVYRSGDNYLSVGGDKSARRCVEVG